MPALPARLLARDVEGRQAGDLEDHPQLQVVLQVLADAGQRVRDRNAVAGEQRRIADAGELQQMRRVHGTGGKDDLAAGAQRS